MTNAELAAYNYGQELARQAVEAVEAGREADFVPACRLGPKQQSVLDQLGQDRWWRFVVQGGQAVLGESDALRPLQT